MQEIKVFRVGGSRVVAIPPYLCDKVGIEDGSTLGIDFVDGIIILKKPEEKSP